MDLKNKNTTLDDSAGIYQKRDVKTEKQKFAELNSQEKWVYFQDYYLKKCIIFIAAVALTIYIAHSIWLAQKQNNIFYAAISDFYFTEEEITSITDEFSELIGKTSKYDKVVFDTNYYLASATDFAAQEKLAALIAVGDLDVFIAPESFFKTYVFSGSMTSLTEQLPTDLYSSLSGDFYYGRVQMEYETIEEASGPLGVYGIYLDSTPLFSRKSYNNRPVLGIVISGKNKANAVEFIRFLSELYIPLENVQ